MHASLFLSVINATSANVIEARDMTRHEPAKRPFFFVFCSDLPGAEHNQGFDMQCIRAI